MTSIENLQTPTAGTVNTDEVRQWLIQHRQTLGLSNAEFAKRIGRPWGTLSQFLSDKGYGGDEQKIAEQVQRYRDTLIAQTQLTADLPEIPDYYETPTTIHLMSLYDWGQRGRMVAIATAAGLGKTKAARRYAMTRNNVFVTTLAPSSSGVNTMQQAVLRSLGEKDAKGTPIALSLRIMDRLRDSAGLLIIDEAQNASEKAVEEIRSWFDAIDVGIVLQGNMNTVARFQSGARAAVFAQINSRCSRKFERHAPVEGDAAAVCAAWNITDERCIKFVNEISTKPGHLRTCTMVIEVAMMLAHAEHRPLTLKDLQDSWTQFATRPVLA